jgi:hypothetical protein
MFESDGTLANHDFICNFISSLVNRSTKTVAIALAPWPLMKADLLASLSKYQHTCEKWILTPQPNGHQDWEDLKLFRIWGSLTSALNSS